MKNGQKITFAVVGYGHIGKRHAAIIAGHPECELVAVCDTLPKEILFSDKTPEVAFFQNLATLLDSTIKPDVVNICTPNGLHAEQALMVLEAGCHVVIEKPMALRKSDCEQVIHKALQAGKQVFCVMQNRYSPPIAWLKKIIEEKALGEIHLMQLNCLWNRDERYYLKNGQPHPWHGSTDLDGGVLFTQFAHFIDILYWLFGDIKNVHSDLSNFRGLTPLPDSGIVHFRLQNEALGSLMFSTIAWDQNFESSITICGSRGSIQIGGQYMNSLRYCHVEGVEIPVWEEAPPPNDYGAYKGSAANHHYVIQNVVDVLRGKKTVSTNALEGLKVVEIIERMMKN